MSQHSVVWWAGALWACAWVMPPLFLAGHLEVGGAPGLLLFAAMVIWVMVYPSSEWMSKQWLRVSEALEKSKVKA